MHAAHSKGIKITHTNLQPGHTHMEAAGIHEIIEKHKKITNAAISKFHVIGLQLSDLFTEARN